MSCPPPPPPTAPPPPMMGAPSAFTPPKGPDNRSALLKSIQKGTKLKKTVTNDKSAPVIGKVANTTSSTSVNNGAANNYGSSCAPNGMPLGGLFAGGMPKLKPTKNRLGTSLSNNITTSNSEQNGFARSPRERSPVAPVPSLHFSSIQNEVKKKLANDNRDRGPPPPTPTSENLTNEFNNLSLQQSNSSASFLHPSIQQSSLHRKTQSNVNLSSVESSLNPPSPGSTLSSRTINHGKPNLAPKPPLLNGKPKTPPKKLVINGKAVSRAHSLRNPRSPTSPASESPVDVAIKYGTVRNMSSVLSHSLGNNINTRSKMTLNGRPSAPPPSVPGTPPSHQPQQGAMAPAPPSKTSVMKPPNHAPPPPPSALPQPPNHAPPPPPHKTLPAKLPGITFSTSQTPPPPPPPRNSSMRDQHSTYKKVSVSEFDERFKDMFKSPSCFPRPPPFRNVLKIYSNRQVINKQQAPPPPSPILPNNRLWDVPSSC